MESSQKMVDCNQQEMPQGWSKKTLTFTTRHHLRRAFSINMRYNLQRLTAKWVASIEPGHWSSTRPQRRTHMRGGCYLLQLPTELLLNITSYLTVVSRASLALTCRQLFLLDDAGLNSECLSFSPDFAPLFKHYRNEYNFATPRWELIRLLENTRWLACSRCLQLHMAAAFPQRERKQQPEDRGCNLGSLAGVVDLCPCIKLTFRGKMDLVELLRARQKTLTALATQHGAGTREPFCWHSCTMNYGSSKIKIRILPDLDENDMLKVRVEYQLAIKAGQLGKEESMIPRLGCAHRAVDLWLASVCNTNDDFGWTPSHVSTCNLCNSTLTCLRKGPLRVGEGSGQAVYDFYIEKCLGSGSLSVPDDQWASQRSHPVGDRRAVGDCDERCPWSPHKYHFRS
ncbi:F-box domain protein [Aspergillus bombycis]|uniref:F-box domain protein n=1 Tax=Aspergillus bombycis TaxID=109264 RepID=A0A1F8AAS7_9EURO|nr:F-box domain protein [Aspergillus bombycis]OGM48824.1 F-box domain protein [Aspergillus bombycis]